MDPTERIARLEAELVEQWWSNHAEHCGLEWPHPSGAFCGWPLPKLLVPERLRRLDSGHFEYASSFRSDVKDVD